MKQLLATVEAQGGTVRLTKGSHFTVKCPDRSKCQGSGIVVLAGTASDHRSIKNGTAALRRCGFAV